MSRFWRIFDKGQPATTHEAIQQAEQIVQALTGVTPPPRTAFIKRTNCHTCGAAKTLPPQTAYVYCDYCGSLTDYDFQKACERPMEMPGPAYEQLLRATFAETQHVLATGNKPRHLEIQRQLFGAWVEMCPNSVSPRAKSDAGYRNQLIEYMAQTATINGFDPTYQQYAALVQQRTAAIQWAGMYPRPICAGATFWPLYEAVRDQLRHSFDLLDREGVLALHPDEAPRSLQERMTWSMFCQGWLPTLDENDSERMLAESGLKGEYVKAEPVETAERHCGRCGGERRVLPGAKVVVCEGCGTKLDVGAPEINCGNCGGAYSFPAGEQRVPCPYCRTEGQRMTW